MPATTDYHSVNDVAETRSRRQPAEANAGMVKCAHRLNTSAVLIGERRITVVLTAVDSVPKLFLQLIADGFEYSHLSQGSPLAWQSSFSSVRKG